MSEPSAALGLKLKAERERRGMSTQKVADEMHLDAWVIEALETGEYQRIGPSVYVKGHLKKYASMLGLTAADVAASYDSQSAAASVAGPLAGSVRMRSTDAQPVNLPWPQIIAVVAIALVVGGALWWRPWRGGHEQGRVATAERNLPVNATSNPDAPSAAAPSASASADSGSADAASSEAVSSAGSQATGADAGTSSAPDARVSAAPAVPVAPAAIPAVLTKAAVAAGPQATQGVGRARLRLSFSADSWVDVHDAEGRRVFAGNGRANSVRTVAGTAPLRVYLGFASGVQLELNDRAVAIGPQFVTGDVAHFEAGADGVLRRDSHAVPTNTEPPRTAPHG